MPTKEKQKSGNMNKIDPIFSLSRINQILLLIVLVFTLLYIGSPFLLPFFFGILFASLMTPFCNLLESIGINRIIASLISTLVVFIVVGFILFLFVYQVDRFISDISSFRDELQLLITNIQKQITSITNLSLEEQSNILQNRSGQLINRIEPQVTNFVGGILNSLFSFLIVLIYLFLLLLYRGKVYEFLMMYTNEKKKEDYKEVLRKVNKVVFHYLWGRAKVMIVLAVMYYITFLIFGLPYAILLTIFGTLITIIPYFGPFVSGLLPILFSFIFFDNLEKALLFTSLIIIIQLTESYVLEPLIIGKEVKLNPLVVIIAVVLGGFIWGIAGMILFVPLFAMFKIVSNNSKGLEPIGFLFGNTRKDSK